MLFASFIFQFTDFMREFKVQLAPPAENICEYQFYLSIVSSRVSDPPWNIDLTPFYLAPLKIILNLSDPPPPSFPFLWTTKPQNFGELDSPLKSTLIQKSNTHFLKKQKILFPTLKIKNTFERWNINIYSCKIEKSKET